jgi:protein-S-isoprenylcysteine O-methyltransferase Ste14
MEGRLLPDELEQRLETVFSARTYGELDTVVADLPVPPAQRSRRTNAAILTRAAIPGAIVLAVLAALVTTASQVGRSAHAGHTDRFAGFDHHATMFLAAAPITGLIAVLALFAALMWMVRERSPWTGGRGGGPAAR